MSALSAIEAGIDEVATPARGASRLRQPGLRLVTAPVLPTRPPSAGRGTRPGSGPERSRIRPPSGQLNLANHGTEIAAPLRLTRRGRVVLATFAVALVTVVIAALGLAAAGGAQAANHGRPGAGYQGMRQIVVRPGQTLWTIATRAEPSVDPRLVISQIMTANSMTSPAVQAGELLWVPK